MNSELPKLTVESLQEEARLFAKRESEHDEPSLYGVTDGKAVGNYVERKFQAELNAKYIYEQGSSAKGVDFPEINVDMKVTSIKLPQSSCPFKSAHQKLYGLGYSLLLFVYQKVDKSETQSSRLEMPHAVFINDHRTGDYQTTTKILEIIRNNGNVDDLVAFMHDRNLPVDDVQAVKLAEEVLQHPPTLGYLTISNALQWRLQYRRSIESAGNIDGIVRIL